MIKNEVLIHAKTWMNGHAKWKKPATEKQIRMILFIYEMSRTGNSIETESRFVVAYSLEEWENWELVAEWCMISFWGNKNVLNLILVMETQVYECIKVYLMGHFK